MIYFIGNYLLLYALAAVMVTVSYYAWFDFEHQQLTIGAVPEMSIAAKDLWIKQMIFLKIEFVRWYHGQWRSTCNICWWFLNGMMFGRGRSIWILERVHCQRWTLMPLFICRGYCMRSILWCNRILWMWWPSWNSMGLICCSRCLKNISNKLYLE